MNSKMDITNKQTLVEGRGEREGKLEFLLLTPAQTANFYSLGAFLGCRTGSRVAYCCTLMSTRKLQIKILQIFSYNYTV